MRGPRVPSYITADGASLRHSATTGSKSQSDPVKNKQYAKNPSIGNRNPLATQLKYETILILPDLTHGGRKKLHQRKLKSIGARQKYSRLTLSVDPVSQFHHCQVSDSPQLLFQCHTDTHTTQIHRQPYRQQMSKHNH